MDQTAILLILFLIFFFVGRLTYINTNKNIATYRSWANQADEKQKVNVGLLFIFVLIVVVVIAAGLFTYGGVQALKEVISNPLTPEEIDRLRAGNTIEGPLAGIFPYFTLGLGKIASFMLLGYAIQQKKKKLLFTSIIVALLILVSQISNLSKSSSVFFLIQTVIFICLIYNVKINLTKILVFSTSFFALFIIIYLLATTAENATMAFDFFKSRIFDEPNRVLNEYVRNWPSHNDHTWGMNIRVVHALFGRGNYMAAESILAGGDKGYTSNVMFIGDAWVDFSYLGVVIESFFVGWFISYVDNNIFKQKTFLNKALFAALISSIFALSSVGLITCLITYGLFTMPLIVKFIKK